LKNKINSFQLSKKLKMGNFFFANETNTAIKETIEKAISDNKVVIYSKTWW
jgi:hypothetical protein